MVTVTGRVRTHELLLTFAGAKKTDGAKDGSQPARASQTAYTRQLTGGLLDGAVEDWLVLVIPLAVGNHHLIDYP